MWQRAVSSSIQVSFAHLRGDVDSLTQRRPRWNSCRCEDADAPRLHLLWSRTLFSAHGEYYLPLLQLEINVLSVKIRQNRRK